MTSVRTTTYRVEERDPDGVVVQTWFRDNLDRAEALRLFRVLVVADDGYGRLYPRGKRRLVVLADPATGPRPNREAVEDLRTAVPASVAARLLDEADEVIARRHLTVVGAR